MTMRTTEEIVNSVIESDLVEYLRQYSPIYDDYIKNIKNTYIHRKYIIKSLMKKANNWDIDHDSFISDFIRLQYAAMLEQFIKDDTAEMFGRIFKDYIISIFNSNDEIFKDSELNTIFHYDAVHGNRLSHYIKIQNVVNDLIRHETGIDDDIFNINILGLVNSKEETVFSIASNS